MSESNQQTPPKGDFDKAEKYINQLVSLIDQNKIEVYRTDLTKFDPTSLQDHYTIGLKDYQIEISHSRHQESGKSSYVIIFNNLKNISEGKGEKVILAYTYLADSQFSKFKIVAERQLNERRRAAEEKRFREAMAPIDDLLMGASAETKADNQPPKPQEIKTDSQSFLSEQQIHQI